MQIPAFEHLLPLLDEDEPKTRLNGAASNGREKIRDGTRNTTLTSLAGSMRRRGMTYEAILAALLAENTQRCEPPLDDKEVGTIARSVSRYEPAEETENSNKPKPRLDAGDHDLERITQATLSVLVAANDPPFIFRYADMISRIQDGDDGSKIIRPFTDKSLRNVLAKIADWRVVKEKYTAPALPPKHVAENILADANPPFPVLTRLVRSPVFAFDGTLRTQPGYDSASKVLYDPFPNFQVTVPSKPTSEDVQSARGVIEDLLCDFPFTGESKRTHAVALLLLPFARELIDGPTPLHLIEKPSPGTGAGLLTDVVTTVFLGRGAAVITEGRDEDEWRKRLTAKIIQDNDVIVIDNVCRRLESAALSSAITSTVWEERRLGKTEMVRMPVRMTWIATGNNPALSNEIARRCVRIRLDSRVDKPWLRGGFRHANLRAYVAQRREKIASAALTLIQYWITQGKPQGFKILGSFENWSKVIGGIVGAAGFKGFLANLDELYEASDAEGEAWRIFVDRWWTTHRDGEIGVADLFKIVAPAIGEPIGIDLGRGNERSQKIRLGIALQQMRDRRFGDKQIIQGGTQQRARMWSLHRVGSE